MSSSRNSIHLPTGLNSQTKSSASKYKPAKLKQINVDNLLDGKNIMELYSPQTVPGRKTEEGIKGRYPPKFETDSQNVTQKLSPKARISHSDMIPTQTPALGSTAGSSSKKAKVGVRDSKLQKSLPVEVTPMMSTQAKSEDSLSMEWVVHEGTQIKDKHPEVLNVVLQDSLMGTPNPSTRREFFSSMNPKASSRKEQLFSEDMHSHVGKQLVKPRPIAQETWTRQVTKKAIPETSTPKSSRVSTDPKKPVDLKKHTLENEKNSLPGRSGTTVGKTTSKSGQSGTTPRTTDKLPCQPRDSAGITAASRKAR